MHVEDQEGGGRGASRQQGPFTSSEEERRRRCHPLDGGRAVAVRAVYAVDLERARLVRHVVRVEDEGLGEDLSERNRRGEE